MTDKAEAQTPLTETERKGLAMLEKAKRVAPLLGDWRILGVDPGYLFVRANEKERGSIDLPSDVVESLLGVDQRMAEMEGKVAAYEFTDTRSDEAHAYCQQHLMPKAWGRHIWHSILDDAIASRAKLTAARQWVEAREAEWRAIANDAQPHPDDDRDLEVMARDKQYAETLRLCADALVTLKEIL